jgi:Fe-S-cluster containining protein
MFKCDKCGLCCKKVGITEQYMYLDRGDGVCRHFNDDSNLCTIYDDRPLICKVKESYEYLYKDQMTIEDFYALNYKACDFMKGVDDNVLFSNFKDLLESVESSTESEVDNENKAEELNTVSDIKSALINKFEEIFGYQPGDDYEPRVRNALEIMCQGQYRKDQLINITDTSISSNGKSGLVLTIDSVCVKDAGNSTSRFIAKYEDIDYTYMKEERFLGVDISALELNMKYGTQYLISIDKINKEKLMEFVDYAMSLYEDDDSLEW